MRWTIRLLLPVLVIAAAGAIAGTLWFGYGQQRELAHFASPGGTYRASLVAESASCGGTFSLSRTSLIVQRRWGAFNAGSFSPFCVSSKSAQVRLLWRDAQTLLIECQGCLPDQYETADVNWGKLRFVYDLGQPKQH